MPNSAPILRCTYASSQCVSIKNGLPPLITSFIEKSPTFPVNALYLPSHNSTATTSGSSLSITSSTSLTLFSNICPVPTRIISFILHFSICTLHFAFTLPCTAIKRQRHQMHALIVCLPQNPLILFPHLLLSPQRAPLNRA